jgi:hypothetical protein
MCVEFYKISSFESLLIDTHGRKKKLDKSYEIVKQTNLLIQLKALQLYFFGQNFDMCNFW